MIVLNMQGIDSVVVEKHEHGQSTMNYQLNTGKTGYVMKYDMRYEVNHVLRKVMLDKPWQRCDAKNGQVFEPCLDKFMLQKVGCRLPWLRNNVSGHEQHRECDKPEDLDRYIQVQKTLSDLDTQKELEDFGCLMSNCIFDQWQPLYQETKTNKVAPGSNQAKFLLELSKKDCLQTTKQILIYGFGNFVADFGGYLGLLLGASLLSIYDRIHDCVESFISRCKKNSSVKN